MSYWDIAEMANDLDLQSRIRACNAQEGANNSAIEFLVICAAPGWADQWASAIAGKVDRPGKDPGVISDGQILASVQQAIAEQQPS